MDDSTIDVPDPGQYTLELGGNGSYLFRADCNLGAGAYHLDASSLTFDAGPITLAACPPGSLSDRYVRDLGFVRSYVMQDGELFLALFADGGILRFSTRRE